VIRTVALLLLIAACVAVWVLSDDVVTSRYATLATARADDVFGKGWLPDILPASAQRIRTSNNPDLNFSEGEFIFAPKDYAQFQSRLGPYVLQDSFALSAEDVARKRSQGFEVATYAQGGNTWVFFCKAAAGHCEYTMWVQQDPGAVVTR
jgi:hypothetical protein